MSFLSRLFSGSNPELEQLRNEGARLGREVRLLENELEAINRSQGVIEFGLDGMILTANENFLRALGYTLAEIQGRHHSMFVESAYAASSDYRQFWADLRDGRFRADEFKRIGKGGREVWIQASYNPVFDTDGKPFKVVKYATDVTAQKLANADFQGQIDAINKSQGTIEFALDGTVQTANDIFLGLLGYSLADIKGRHHSLFVEPAYANSPEYARFWEQLRRGEYSAGEYKRIGRGGKEVWIQASYNPIFDLNGKPFKVVKYAADITEQKVRNAEIAGQLQAIDKSQGVIEFTLDGTVLRANDNFLDALGYQSSEIVGRHHSMFVDPAYVSSQEYKSFWSKLGRGEHDAGVYKRIGKGGREIWIQASYNPIFDASGRPCKVVKFATDITAQKRYQMTVEEILRATSTVMTGVAEGNLTQRIEAEYDGEFAALKSAVNDSVAQLKNIVGEINEGAASINTAAREVAKGNVELSARTEEQASSLEETAASMEEMTATVQKNAENAQEATRLAISARDLASVGGTVVSRAVSAMAEINQASRKIADIIGVIDEIAFQTNLLALNAAVEAARAGEQGRGFAVVASEVRNLAQRSATAAKEIKALIHDSAEKVTEGSKLVDESGATLGEIVVAAKKVSDIVEEIASASMEQSSGIQQVNKAVAQMDQTTQQNAALVEEAAAASETMDEESKRLIALVRFFDTGAPEIAVLPAAATAAAAPVAKPGAATSAGRGHGRKTSSVATLKRVKTASAAAAPALDEAHADSDWETF
ncbi:MAG: PAS domain S-box protein [Gammaproteobacteria bacterium]|nr:PAS domain S-box protein [Gammaproteobacteria bacterium]